MDSASRCLPLSTVHAVIPIIIQAIDALSVSATPFPVPNRHPPPEILNQIYLEVLKEEDPSVLQSAIRVLSRTSIAWRRIVLPRCKQLYLGNREILERWLGIHTLTEWQRAASRKRTLSFDRADDLYELHVDLSRDYLQGFEPSLLRCALSQSPETPKSSSSTLTAEEDNFPLECRHQYFEEITELVRLRSNYDSNACLHQWRNARVY